MLKWVKKKNILVDIEKLFIWTVIENYSKGDGYYTIYCKCQYNEEQFCSQVLCIHYFLEKQKAHTTREVIKINNLRNSR